MRIAPLFPFAVAPIAIAFAATLAAETGQVEVPGRRDGAAMVYPADGFDSIALGTAATVDVRVGRSWSIRATGPAAALADFRVLRGAHSIELTRRDRAGPGDPRLERQVRIAITLPRLTAAAIGGAGTIRVDRVSGKSFDGAVGGSGTLAIGAMAVEQASISIGGSGNITAGGTAGMLKVNLGGSGGLDAPALAARRASIAVAGSGGVRARVDGPAKVTIVGSGAVDLGPRATCTVTRMGSGRVICGR